MKYVFRKLRFKILATLLDAIGYSLLWLSHPRGQLTKRRFKNILIVRMDHLGDVLLSTGAPKSIKENFPDARLTFLTASWAAPLLENNPFIDEVLTYDAPWFLQNRYKKNFSGVSFFQLVRLLKRKNFDLGIGLRGDIRENLMLWLSGIPERIGYGVTGAGFFLTKEVHYRERIHERDRLVNLLRPLGIRGDIFQSRLYVSNAERSSSDKILLKLGIVETDRLVGFQCGAGAASKDWPVESTLIFLKRFGGEFPGRKIVLVGTRSEIDGLGEARTLAHCVDLVGKTTLRELCALMPRFSFFIGPDSGPTHIAAAMGIPAIFLFSGTNRFEEWRPLSESSSVMRHPVSCSPCGLRFCNVKGHPCMSEIKPEDVLKDLRTRLESSERTP